MVFMWIVLHVVVKVSSVDDTCVLLILFDKSNDIN